MLRYNIVLRNHEPAIITMLRILTNVFYLGGGVTSALKQFIFPFAKANRTSDEFKIIDLLIIILASIRLGAMLFSNL